MEYNADDITSSNPDGGSFEIARGRINVTKLNEAESKKFKKEQNQKYKYYCYLQNDLYYGATLLLSVSGNAILAYAGVSSNFLRPFTLVVIMVASTLYTIQNMYCFKMVEALNNNPSNNFNIAKIEENLDEVASGGDGNNPSLNQEFEPQTLAFESFSKTEFGEEYSTLEDNSILAGLWNNIGYEEYEETTL